MINQMGTAEYPLWQGVAKVIVGGASHEVDCQAVLRSCRDLNLKISVTDRSKLDGPELVNILNGELTNIALPGVAEPIKAFRVDSALSKGELSITLRPTRSPIWLVRSQILSRGRAEIVNFAHYFIGPRSKFELKACGWTADFIPVSEETLVVAKSMQNEEYQLSHQVEFARENGLPFTTNEAQDFLDKLSLFLSFCHGHWVGISFAAGMNSEGEVALLQLGTGRVGPLRDPSGWLDQYEATGACKLFETFYSRLLDPSWSEAISHVIYWFARADANSIGPDGACILLQAALERFAWHLLIRERKMISEKGFRELDVADQLRMLLSVLSIPLSIPSGLNDMQALGKARELDGPGAFTFIRNRIVHPPKSSDKTGTLPFYEAYRLAKWYMELAVLSACDYVGEYSDRTLPKRWAGVVETVPWA